MSGVERYRVRDDTDGYQIGDGAITDVVLATSYDALAAENARLERERDDYRLTHMTIAGVLGFSAPASHTQLCAEARAAVDTIARQAGELTRLRAALTTLSKRPSGHHDCDDYSRGYGQAQAEAANVAIAALRPVAAGEE